jgi:hypothetical protein
MKEAPGSSETSVLTRATRRNNPEDNILHNLVKDENGDLLADSNTFVNKWKSYFSQLLNVLNFRDISQREIRASEPLLSDSIHLEAEIPNIKPKE